ncbi:unnamed protein product [Rhodiola kirilowii]
MTDQDQEHFLRRLDKLVEVDRKVRDLSGMYMQLQEDILQAAMQGLDYQSIQARSERLLQKIAAKSTLKRDLIRQLNHSNMVWATTKHQVTIIDNLLEPVEEIIVPAEVEDRAAIVAYGDGKGIGMLLP